MKPKAGSWKRSIKSIIYKPLIRLKKKKKRGSSNHGSLETNSTPRLGTYICHWCSRKKKKKKERKREMNIRYEKDYFRYHAH